MHFLRILLKGLYLSLFLTQNNSVLDFFYQRAIFLQPGMELRAKGLVSSPGSRSTLEQVTLRSFNFFSLMKGK